MLKRKDLVKLLSIPIPNNKYLSCDYRDCLTVGNLYYITNFEGSNVVITTDDPNRKAYISQDRVEKVTTPIILGEFGLAVWKHRYSKNLFAHREYAHCDRIIILDETTDRRIIFDDRFSTFSFDDWIPMTEIEYKSVKDCYKEIYNEQVS